MSSFLQAVDHNPHYCTSQNFDLMMAPDGKTGDHQSYDQFFLMETWKSLPHWMAIRHSYPHITHNHKYQPHVPRKASKFIISGPWMSALQYAGEKWWTNWHKPRFTESLKVLSHSQWVYNSASCLANLCFLITCQEKVFSFEKRSRDWHQFLQTSCIVKVLQKPSNKFSHTHFHFLLWILSHI